MNHTTLPLVFGLRFNSKSGPIPAMTCRLYIDCDLAPGSSVELPADQSHYLHTVMRLGAGDCVILFNGRAGEYSGTIKTLSKQRATIHLQSFSDIDREMPCRVHIVQAACRSEKIDSILQKGTELGAASFHIVRSERSSLKLEGGRLNKRLERWQKIISEAAEQSERTAMPEINWLDKLTDSPATGLCYALHPETDTHWSAEKENIIAAKDITLAIGPEGGWSPRDIELLASLGFKSLTFGPRIMRTETAAPALLAAIQSLIDSQAI
ncbi:16S rRNA (uracil1498-N3)-methyltransferase [Mariprofundus ferrinatatus]|uniref:Ribosomal RNA small subunit methyltransferase E n=1 Tax=Mariprofundus ferrinatatus TaxID=1921087 RepID=A0A2K8L605_9PROT|nr:16S rRNA (uracil(1498)-N(3))-methyltransferase [Mariprofundus ferrinatatus]ATX82673.1 16S rRNA (uracil1498-N3)-methyltransferase [Mariprofundus ferrinatatus]